jgi:hypothetical protein
MSFLVLSAFLSPLLMSLALTVVVWVHTVHDIDVRVAMALTYQARGGQ